MCEYFRGIEIRNGEKSILNLSIPFTINKQNDDHDFIKYMVYEARNSFLKENFCKNNYLLGKNPIFDIGKINFTDYCQVMSQNIQALCNKSGVESELIQINSGFAKQISLASEFLTHFFNVVKYNGKYFLIDLTYSQFFLKRFSNIDRLGVAGLSGCFPGTYMLINSKSKQLAEQLIKDGFIELTEENFKLYMDGFTLSFRNGLYYENNGILTCNSNYTVDDYIRFLDGDDSQFNHEGEENLGYQQKPLRNHNLNFRNIIK